MSVVSQRRFEKENCLGYEKIEITSVRESECEIEKIVNSLNRKQIKEEIVICTQRTKRLRKEGMNKRGDRKSCTLRAKSTAITHKATYLPTYLPRT